MARKAETGPGPGLDGALISVDREERLRLKALRKAKGLTQFELAARVGATGPTISNFETYRHPQVERSMYLRIKLVLRDKAEPANDDDRRVRLAERLMDIDSRGLDILETLLDTLKKQQ